MRDIGTNEPEVLDWFRVAMAENMDPNLISGNEVSVIRLMDAAVDRTEQLSVAVAEALVKLGHRGRGPLSREEGDQLIQSVLNEAARQAVYSMSAAYVMRRRIVAAVRLTEIGGVEDERPHT